MDNQDILNNKSKGYVKIYRSFIEGPLWKSERVKSRSMAWLYLIVKANHRPNKVAIGHEDVSVSRGEVLTSQKDLGEAWGWSRSKVRTFLEYLTRQKMVEVYTSTKFTTIKVLNYALYNDSQESPIFFGSNQPTQQPQLDQDSAHTNNSLSINYEGEQPLLNHLSARSAATSHIYNQDSEHLNNSESDNYNEEQPLDNQDLDIKKTSKEHQSATNNNGKNGNKGKEDLSNNSNNNNRGENFEKNGDNGQIIPPVPPAPPQKIDISRYTRMEKATKPDFTIEECWELFKYDEEVAVISRNTLLIAHTHLKEDPDLFEQYGQAYLYNLKVKLITTMPLSTFSQGFHFWFKSNLHKSIEQLGIQSFVKNKNHGSTDRKSNGGNGFKASYTGYDKPA